jgi:tripartite motif-containing protein 71
MTRPRRQLASSSLLRLLPPALLACLAGALPTPARADACAGSGGPCPYASAAIIGPRAEGVLRFPEAVAADAMGNVYVADQLGYVVQKFTSAGAFVTEWGSYGGGHGQFGPIGGLATDPAGNVYVVDSSHNRIQKFDPNGNFITSWGGHGSAPGRFNFGSSQNPTQPPGGGIAVTANYVYVADSGNHRIERFNLQGGEPIQWGSLGNSPGNFYYPRGVAANEGEVIVADDDNHRILKFDPNGVFQGAVGSRGGGPGQFAFPYGVALDAAGNIYVADNINHRVVKLSPQLQFLGAWGGPGSKAGQLSFPRALAADAAGNTYVADTANHRVQVFDPNGNYLRAFGVSARSRGVLTAPRGLAADPTGRLLAADTVGNRIELLAPGTNAFLGQWAAAGGYHSGFNNPAGIAVDPRGSVLVADQANGRVVRLWGDGTFLGEVGGPAGRGGAQLTGAGTVAVAPASGVYYVADTSHNRVLVYGPDDSLLAKWGAGGGNGAAGSGPGEFNRPAGVAVDGAGDLYVADTGNDRIVRLSQAGTALVSWGSRGSGNGRFRSASGVAVDAAGRVYVVDSLNNRVQVFNQSGRFLAKWGERGSWLGAFSQPTAIAIDCSGRVYVADTNNNRLQRFDLVSPAGVGCLAAGAWPPPLDVAPVLRVSLQRRGAVLARRAVALAVSCQRGCKVLATARLSPRGARQAVPLVAAARSLAPALTGHLRLRVGPHGLRRLRKALGRRRQLVARVTIVAAGPTGRRTTLARTYHVTR